MKKLSIVLMALALLCALTWPLHAETKSATFEVSGWTCGSCASATRIALKKLDGVQDVKTDHDKAEVLVTYDDAKVTTDRMVQAIAKLGYKATLKNGGTPAGPARSPRFPSAAPPIASKSAAPSPERVSLFEVPLECAAKEGLGCGSAAKPILKELAKDSTIADARINYAGTVLAVVWKDPGVRSDEAIETLFDKRHLAAAALRGEARKKALEEFRTGAWYGAADVDRLSEDEARVIAARIVNRAKPRLGLAPDRVEALTEDLAVVFARHMTGEECDVRREVVEEELVQAASKHLNAEQMAELRKAGEQGIMALPGEAK
ncbi:MAG TPA: heavy-metal-associated domain-containing protein [Thermoanaerobaculia bacterium]|nr:heavy-metal-associated domain-containing protein [Thermoanaerobaculia bacterium]